MRIHSNSTLAKLRSISKHTNLRACSVFTGAASPPATSSSLPHRKKGHRHKEFLVATHLEEEGVEYCRISTSDERTYKVRQLWFPDTERSTFFYPDSYCNELMLASSASYSMMHAALWNPTTDEVMSLPPSTAWRPLIEASSIIYYGLGFDPSSQDYKVIRILRNRAAELYSLINDSWKEIPYPHYPASPRGGKFSIYINGFQYWVDSNPRRTGSCIISFDYVNEVFPRAKIPLPPSRFPIDPCSNLCLAEFDGSLAAVVSMENREIRGRWMDRFEFEIWVWNGESWARVKSDVTDVNHTIVRIMGLFNNDKLFLGDEKSEVVLWDCTTRELKYLRTYVHPWFSIIAPYVARHMPIGRKNISPPCMQRDVGPRSSVVNSPNRATTKYVIDRGEFQDKLCFCHLIVEHHQKNGLEGTHSRLDFTFWKHSDYFLPIDSCRSLVLVSTNKEGDLQYALWNPTTNEVKPLPESSIPLPPYTACTEINSWAFGFDPVSLDYKVVRFLEFYDEDHDEVHDYFRAEIYSLENDSWKEIARPSHLLVSGLSRQRIHINGFCYWRSLTGIIPFDLAKEEFLTHIPFPQSKIPFIHNFRLAELDGSLASIVYRTPDCLVTAERPFEFEVWIWNDDGSWTRVNSQIITGAAVDDVLGIFNNDKLFLHDMKGDVLVFDLLTSELTNTGSCAGPRECNWIYPYVESEEPIRTYLHDDVRSIS